MNDLFSLAGKVAVVTGATGVLGSEMARSLAESGASVAVLGRREEKAHRVAGELEVAGGESVALFADVLDTDQLQEARDALLERWGRVGTHAPVPPAGAIRTSFRRPDTPCSGAWAG